MLTAVIVAMMLQANPAKTDACALLTNEDVQRVLGVSVRERQPGTQDARGVLLAQCYLSTGSARSISIALAGSTRAGGRTITPRQFWRDNFHEKDEGKAAAPESEARPVAGVGDEAYWSGSRVAGALYVLRGDRFIRVSVGGIADENQRIEASRRLALAALGHIK